MYGRSSSTVYPSAYVTAIQSNAFQTPALIASGSTPDTSTRYGDYFGAGTDFSTSTFWVGGEYRVDSTFQNWSTAIAPITLSSTTGSFDFSLSNSGGITVTQGSSGTNTITASLVSGSAQPVSLSCSGGLPSGASCAFNPQSGNPTYSSALTISTSSTTPTGSAVITITGTSGAITHTTQFMLTVNPVTMMTVSYSIVGGGNPSPPVFNYVQGGMPQQYTLTTQPTALTVDFGSSWSVTNPLQGSTGAERWWASQPAKGKATAETINFAYQHQYRLTMKLNPSTGGTVTPVSSWQNSGSSITIQATPASNFAFLSWTGGGTGSYTGTNNPATVTINGPITETAAFQQTGGQLSVSLVSPKNGVTLTSSPVTLKVTIAGFVQGATVTVFLDGNQVCSGSSDPTGSFSCKFAVNQTGGTHSWYAVASKTGFTSGTSPMWTFTY